MRHSPPIKADRERDVQALAWIVELIDARRRRNARAVAEARKELARLGITIEFGMAPAGKEANYA